jgi:hypothetical protein
LFPALGLSKKRRKLRCVVAPQRGSIAESLQVKDVSVKSMRRMTAGHTWYYARCVLCDKLSLYVGQIVSNHGISRRAAKCELFLVVVIDAILIQFLEALLAKFWMGSGSLGH